MSIPSATKADLERAVFELKDAAAIIGLRDIDESFWKNLSVQHRALIGVAMGWPTVYKAHFIRPEEDTTLVRFPEQLNTPETFIGECFFDNSIRKPVVP